MHFWVGLFAAPTLLLLACTGLFILHTQPLDLWLHRDLKVVAAVTPSGTGTSAVSLDTQIDFMAPDNADMGERNVTQVYVDPYAGDYLGQRREL